MEIEGAPFLPEVMCPFTANVLSGLVDTGLTAETVAEVSGLSRGGGGLHSGGGMAQLGCDRLTLEDASTETGGEDGTALGDFGDMEGRSLGAPSTIPGSSLCGEAGGVWKLSNWFPGGNNHKFSSMSTSSRRKNSIGVAS